VGCKVPLHAGNILVVVVAGMLVVINIEFVHGRRGRNGNDSQKQSPILGAFRRTAILQDRTIIEAVVACGVTLLGCQTVPLECLFHGCRLHTVRTVPETSRSPQLFDYDDETSVVRSGAESEQRNYFTMHQGSDGRLKLTFGQNSPLLALAQIARFPRFVASRRIL
jgi:hypothetical protein